MKRSRREEWTNEKNIYKAARNSMKIKMGNKILPCSPPMLLCVLPNAFVGVRKKTEEIANAVWAYSWIERILCWYQGTGLGVSFCLYR